MPETRYITTPIYYCNDVPHIGHVYTTTICDVYARCMRFAGLDVFFLTGTDEHGVKVEKSAQARGISPQALADENAAVFRNALTLFGQTNDDFIRTTEARHERQVQTFVRRLLDADAIYLGEFEGWYDEGQEEYHTETKAKELNYQSPISKKPLTRAREKNYYFRLSAFQKPLEDFFAQHPGFVRPDARRNEVLGRLSDGLQDVPISRTNFAWGILMPNDSKHCIYVWVDALFNYITALGLGEAPDHEQRRAREKYWPATYHVIGKEILWFHAVIWPAILMALKLPLPQCIYAHSFWISEGQKMSKSLGNFIDLQAIQRYVRAYGLDAWRYYLATQGPLGAQDANFSAAHFHETYTTDLVNTVGNCASRVTQMIVKYFDGAVPAPQGRQTDKSTGQQVNKSTSRQPPAFVDWPAEAGKAVAEARRAMDALDLSGSIAAALALIRKVDGYINATEPFKLAKDDSKRPQLATILYECIEAVRIASLLLWPVMPTKMAELWDALGQSDRAGTLSELATWGGLEPGTNVQKIALFPRVEQTPSAAPVSVPA